MRIFVFKSDGKGELRAFTGDLPGLKLPERLGPWHAVGSVAPGAELPHNMSRVEVEKAIEQQGFQLWRFKPKVKAATA